MADPWALRRVWCRGGGAKVRARPIPLSHSHRCWRRMVENPHLRCSCSVEAGQRCVCPYCKRQLSQNRGYVPRHHFGQRTRR